MFSSTASTRAGQLDLLASGAREELFVTGRFFYSSFFGQRYFWFYSVLGGSFFNCFFLITENISGNEFINR